MIINNNNNDNNINENREASFFDSTVLNNRSSLDTISKCGLLVR